MYSSKSRKWYRAKSYRTVTYGEPETIFFHDEFRRHLGKQQRERLLRGRPALGTSCIVPLSLSLCLSGWCRTARNICIVCLLHKMNASKSLMILNRRILLLIICFLRNKTTNSPKYYFACTLIQKEIRLDLQSNSFHALSRLILCLLFQYTIRTSLLVPFRNPLCLNTPAVHEDTIFCLRLFVLLNLRTYNETAYTISIIIPPHRSNISSIGHDPTLVEEV